MSDPKLETPAPAEVLSLPSSPVTDAVGALMSEFGASSGTALRKARPASWGVAVLWDEEGGEVTLNGMVAVSVHRRLLDAALTRAQAAALAEREAERLRAMNREMIAFWRNLGNPMLAAAAKDLEEKLDALTPTQEAQP